MKKLLFALLPAALIFAGSLPAFAINPVADAHAPGQITNQVTEKQAADAAAENPKKSRADQEREETVTEIQNLLKADELDQRNTMAEALRQENLSDMVRGHEDLEIAMAQKNVDLHLGKNLIDMHGNRVRMEEYVVRPADNQVQFLNLTMRDQRLDYINYTATFNTTVPRDTNGIWEKQWRTQPAVYLTAENLTYSNLQDSVALNSLWFTPTWDTLVQRYILPQKQNSLYVNNILKLGAERATPYVDMTPMAGQVGLSQWLPGYTDGNYLAPRVKLVFNDGTYLQLETYRISDKGEIRTVRNWKDVAYWGEHLNELVFNTYKETIWTATEFEGRTIDTVSQFLHLVDVFDNEEQHW